MPADAAPRRSTPWLRAPSSTLSTRSTISPTCSPALPIIRHGALPNSCPGIGSLPTPPASPPKPAHSPSAYSQNLIEPLPADRFRHGTVRDHLVVVESRRCLGSL